MGTSMSSQVLSITRNNPAANTGYGGWQMFCLYTGSGSFDARCQTWSGPNGTGALTVYGTLQVWAHDFTSNTNPNTVSGAFDDAHCSALVSTVGHVYGITAAVSGSGCGSMKFILTYDNTWGILVPLVRRGGLWRPSEGSYSGVVKVRRSGAWVTSGIRVRRSGAWVG